MAQVSGETWWRPLQAPMDAAVAGVLFEGAVLKASSTAGQLQIITAKGDEAYAVLDEPVVDVRGDARAVVVGERLPVWRLGSGVTVKVASVISQAYTPGAKVYLDDAVDGQCTAAHSTSRPIGHFPYFGYKSRTTAAAGELIPVVLDIAIGTAAE